MNARQYDYPEQLKKSVSGGVLSPKLVGTLSSNFSGGLS